MQELAANSEMALYRFNRLIQELLRGSMKRNCFRPWEIEILLDIESCDIGRSNRRETLRRYQRAVQRQFDRGECLPMKFSEYLQTRRARGRKAASSNGQDGNRAGAGSASDASD